MFYENQNTTYKNVFKPFENIQSNIYSNLPEDTLKDKLYKLRIINGLTQKEFSIKTGVGYSSICKYESGWNISRRNKEKICSSFNIPQDYFDL